MRRRGSRRCAVGAAVLGLGGFRHLDRMKGGGGKQKVFVMSAIRQRTIERSVVLESDAFEFGNDTIRGYEPTNIRKLRTRIR
jgi:hypothetical protein